MFKKILSVFSGDSTAKLVHALSPEVDAITQLEAKYQSFSDEALKAETFVLKERYAMLIEQDDDDDDGEDEGAELHKDFW